VVAESQICTVLMDLNVAMNEIWFNRELIHRDLKPENLFLDGNPNELLRIKVGDFGLAKEFNTSPPFPNLGTAEYIAPEIRNGAPCDQTVDVYSIGVILYELIFGEVPPLTNQKSISVPSLPGISEELRSLVEHMLAPNPKDRLNYKNLSQATDNYVKTIKETSDFVCMLHLQHQHTLANSQVKIQQRINQLVSAPVILQRSNPPVLPDSPKRQ